MEYTYFMKLAFMVVFAATVAMSITALVYATKAEEYTETLFSSNLTTTTFKKSNDLMLVYSYSIESGNGSNKGYFKVSVDGNFEIPSMGFGVKDQLGRNIMAPPSPVVGKITTVNFEGRPDSTSIDLYVSPKTGNIELKNITVKLYK